MSESNHTSDNSIEQLSIDNPKEVANRLINGLYHGKIKPAQAAQIVALLDRPFVERREEREDREQKLKAAKMLLDFRKQGVNVGDDFLKLFGINGHVAPSLAPAPPDGG